MLSSLVTLAETAHETESAAPNPYVYGGVTLAILLFMLLVAFAFRSVGTRHR
ncbi:hypothetical protein Bcav_1633 [Beutenbergia cavernae DSM 12333]|uniref:Uncharacterized protein n=1 Tax=Beutenbergia cavernae (strain ATCC BAA-8 / DSM 12333 / CCUG 43141 / JCM 11478 / NBRC 16432 / NCIMB 13614 / HKI 0122) TaxID=471853 RepID=C5C3X6_BEUC1|nr:hypothetical protein [Beutenbergia cavernae]ACQ79889.1 hypothetical protein Bcav_1633 [Beutenbergia cavernae DSM 12333]